MPKLKKVDNSSDGNCLYYAYGISLMYHLRKNGNRADAESIFHRLGLNPAEKAKLFYLLGNEKNKPFTSLHIKRIIEPILGSALRHYAANMTRENFLENPKGSSLYTATNYGMIFLFKKMLQQKKHPALVLFESDSFDNENYNTAEIFKVENMSAEMYAFMNAKFEEIINIFDHEWFAEKREPKSFTELGDYLFHLKQHLTDVIGDMTVAFFLGEEHTNLEAYIRHLSTNYRWGTEETLMLMHCKLQGEIRERIDDEHVAIRYETPMALQIYRDGTPYFSSEEHGTPDIILNNSANTHWFSFIDSKFYSINSEHILRNDLLDIVGFNAYLQKMLEKGDDLAKADKQASDELYVLHKKLSEEKDKFLAKESPITRKEFAASCNALLSDPNATKELQKQCGALDILSNIINCLYLIVTCDFSNLLMGNFNVINPLGINSMFHRVDLIKTSLKISVKELENSEIPDDNNQLGFE
ncbi:hypothetical protein [Fluoribacter gormanii]|uniref:Dot/Icm T4SS effector n=1 Tax=Fluoribacter gormanii TaxID=464 RepID=A0A377GJ94_9GAMM|nr:hypothetical protein [Fluoribacter gormanii]KTD00883.1 Dot/Icm T4SS effector [Fluoribacter gormanii]SIR48899.1 hypothetical protein SAMN05421777_11374 [Fluoribacter gormanii]STO24818.1 Uncharacterised protein [Fluoribacter gormanii]